MLGMVRQARTASRALMVSLVVMTCALGVAWPAQAGTTVGSFEIEGNLKDDSGAGEPIDWSSVPPPPDLTVFTDRVGNPDDIFGLGSKELDPAGWKCVIGSAPSKDDLVNGAISVRTLNGKQYAYARWRRAGVNGDAHIDYEFNQSTEANPSCPDLPRRQAGDILISFDTENGGKTIIVRAFRWTGSTFSPLAVGSRGLTWDGAVNIPSDPTDPALAGVGAGGFGELALNLTDTIGTVTCGQFATAYMKTRASTSINAALKDRTEKQPFNPGDCPDSALAKAVRNVTAGEAFTASGPTSTTAKPGDAIEYRLTYTNAGDAAATGVKVTDPVPAHSTFTGCSDGCTVADGVITWDLGTMAAGATKAVTFTTTLASTFPSGSTDVKNVGTVDTAEEPPKNSNETTVTVTAAPESSLAKAARNVTAGGEFASSITAKPGETVEYRLSYTNAGDAAATNVVVSDPIPPNTTFVSCSNDCTRTGDPVTAVSWSLGTVQPGDTVVRTFQVRIADPVPDGEETIRNVGTVDTTEEPPTDSPPVIVTVIQPPRSSLAKAVRNVTAGEAFTATGPTATTAKPGDSIEYRLTYANSGGSAATNVVVSDPVPANSTFVSCSDGCTVADGVITWNLGTIAAGDGKAVTFVVALAPSFPSGSTPVRNTGTVDTAEEPPKNSNETTVTVTAAPRSELAKAVRNVTAGEAFTATGPTSTAANPGDSIEYRLSYANTGDAPAGDVVLTDALPAHSTFVSCSDGCTVADGVITWNLGTIAAGAGKTVTFLTTLDASFPAGTTDVKNVGVADSAEEPPKSSNETTVTVSAAPNLGLLKTASTQQLQSGQEVTYTLAYANTGNATATGVTIVEAIPSGTEFVSCTGGCSTNGPPVTTATWAIGTVPAGGSGSVTLTVRALSSVGCTVCNIAQISSPDQGGGTAIPSNEVCIGATPSANPAGANASGAATGAHVTVGLLGLDETLPEPDSGDPADPSVQSSQSGVGADGAEKEFLGVALPDAGGAVLKASVLRTTTSSTVGDEPARSHDTSVAESVGVNVLGGLVTADVVRGVAQATATGDGSSFSTAGSTFENLVVNGQRINDVAPGQVVDLPDALFGPDSHVKLLDVSGSTSRPDDGQLSGGTYAAQVEVAMIRVRATLPGLGLVHVVVSDAAAAADFPQTRLCSGVPVQAVSGHAFIAQETTDPAILPLTAGFVSVPATGGHQNQHLNAVALPDDGSVVTSATSESDSTGTLSGSDSTASSYAQAEDLCLLPDGGACTVRATLVRSQANSAAAGGGAASNADGTQLVGLEVFGTPIDATPPPNTVIELPGLGFLVLNEQVCDDGAALPACGGETHTGLTVRAAHLVLTLPTAPLLAGAEVIVAEAHSDATYAE